MSKCGGYSSKSKPIRQGKESAQMDPPLLFILVKIQLKIIINNPGHIVQLTRPGEQVR